MYERPVLIVDALNVFVRHYAANPSMNESGEHVGGFLGFIKNISLLCERTNPFEVIIVWEGGGSHRRRSVLSTYKDRRRPVKMNRYYGEEIPDTLENRNKQISLCIEALECTPCKQIYVSDCEADDIIAWIAKYEHTEKRKVIVSSDRDLYQLLNKKVIQWSPGQKTFVTPLTVVEKFGISATNFCTARAFIGDSSDKIDGVRSAGFTSMAKRFPELRNQNHVSIEDIFSLAEQRIETKQLKLYQNIISSKALVRRNWKLMYLDTMNLSAEHVKRISELFQKNSPPANKINLLKIFRRECIKNFNVDSFFITLKAVREKSEI